MIDLVIDSRTKDLGGFSVGRVLPSPRRRMVGPFIFVDHIGPADFTPGSGGIDVRPHPHIGLSTVTYLFEGEIQHYDNLDTAQAIRPGEVNWMTAGRGIVHSERTDPQIKARGGRLHGMQVWAALPRDAEETDPSFAHHGPADLPTFQEGGQWARLVAGEAFGVRAKVPVRSPLYYVHWELKAGTRAAPPSGYAENALFVARGEVEAEARTFTAGQLLIFGAGDLPTIQAHQDATLMLFGGEPVGQRYIWWNFVSSSRERIEQAKADWSQGRLALPQQDDAEFIPLPDDPPPPPEPMS